MKIEKEIIFKMELNEEELLLLKAGVAHIANNSITDKEQELAENLHKKMHEALINA